MRFALCPYKGNRFVGIGAASSNTVIENPNRVSYVGNVAGHVARALAEVPISGKMYWEVEQFSNSLGSLVEFSGVATDGAAILNATTLGSAASSGDCGVAYKNSNAEYIVYQNGSGTTVTGADTTLDPFCRFGIAVDASTRNVWIRQVWPGGASAWVGGGNPATGTTPTKTIGGSSPIYPAVSTTEAAPGYCTILTNPASWYSTAPSGFTAGVSTQHSPIVIGGLPSHHNTSDTASGSYSATNGSGSYTFHTDGTLPAGLAVSSAGARSGTYTTAGTSQYQVNVQDTNNQLGTYYQTQIVGSGTFTLTGTLPNATVGLAYSANLALGGAYTGPLTMGASVGSLPAWMTATPYPDLGYVTYAGTPSVTAGAVSFTPTATDSLSSVATGSSQSVAVNALPAIAVGASAYKQQNGVTPAVNTQPSGSSFFLIVSEGYSNGAGTVTTPTDNMGNTYTQLGSTIQATADLMQGSVWYCKNGKGGNGHRWTVYSQHDAPTIYACEVVGAKVDANLVNAYTGSASAGTTWASGNITTTFAKCLLLGLLSYDESASPANATANGAFTLVGSTPTAFGGEGAAISYQSVSTVITTQASFSCGGGTYGIPFIVALESAS